MQVEKVYMVGFMLSFLLVGAVLVVGLFVVFPALLLLALILFILQLLVFDQGLKMRCRDTWALLNESIQAQRDNLIWYMSNGMHEFKTPGYQLILAESFFDKGKTIHTQLAKLIVKAREESREKAISEISDQLEEWEILLNQLQDRINQLDRSGKI
ncbi:MAG: hypothetical protein ACFFEK_16400 [Candidatus Thorarchaeota archaeon]